MTLQLVADLRVVGEAQGVAVGRLPHRAGEEAGRCVVHLDPHQRGRVRGRERNPAHARGVGGRGIEIEVLTDEAGGALDDHPGAQGEVVVDLERQGAGQADRLDLGVHREIAAFPVRVPGAAHSHRNDLAQTEGEAVVDRYDQEAGRQPRAESGLAAIVGSQLGSARPILVAAGHGIALVVVGIAVVLDVDIGVVDRQLGDPLVDESHGRRVVERGARIVGKQRAACHRTAPARRVGGRYHEAAGLCLGRAEQSADDQGAEQWQWFSGKQAGNIVFVVQGFTPGGC